MYDGNPGEIYFGSSYREVRVCEGSSYRESTVENDPINVSLGEKRAKRLKTCFRPIA